MDRHHIFPLGPEFEGDSSAVEKLFVHVELANGYSKDFFAVKFRKLYLDYGDILLTAESDLWWTPARTVLNILTPSNTERSPIQGTW